MRVLSHSGELQRKYNLENLELHRLAVECVSELGRSFDLVVCTGVLHHLPDPDSDFGPFATYAAERRDAPDGLCALRPARNYMIQEYCRLLEIEPSAADLQGLGAALNSLPPDHPISGLLRRSKDFLRPNAMADALLNPQDRAYTVPEVYAWLDRCGMSFGRWIAQAPYLAQCGVLSASPHGSRLAALAARQQHAAVELFRGTMVSHDFIAYRDDWPDGTGRSPLLAIVGATTSPCTAMDGLRSRTSASRRCRGVNQPVTHVYRSYSHRRFVRGSASRGHRWEANDWRNTAVCLAGRRR